MNFREIEDLENQVFSDKTTTLDFHNDILEDYLEREKSKSSAKNNPFVYFYEDVIGQAMEYDFQPTLGPKYYKSASEDALSCLNVCDDFYKLSSWSVTGWLQNALKFIDHIVLHYILDVLKEKPKKYKELGIESSRYRQLSEKKGDISHVGLKLKELYVLRNGLEHRTITHPDGSQELISPQRSKVRKLVAKYYPDSLRRLLKTYKEIKNQ